MKGGGRKEKGALKTKKKDKALDVHNSLLVKQWCATLWDLKGEVVKGGGRKEKGALKTSSSNQLKGTKVILLYHVCQNSYLFLSKGCMNRTHGGGGGRGGHSGAEGRGDAPALHISRRKGSFLRPPHVRDFVKERYVFVPRYEVWGMTGLPSL